MLAHEGLEIVAELSQASARDAFGEGVEGVTQPSVVERDVHVFRKAGNDAEHFGERGATLERHRQSVGHGEQSLQHPANPDIFLQHNG